MSFITQTPEEKLAIVDSNIAAIKQSLANLKQQHDAADIARISTQTEFLRLASYDVGQQDLEKLLEAKSQYDRSIEELQLVTKIATTTASLTIQEKDRLYAIISIRDRRILDLENELLETRARQVTSSIENDDAKWIIAILQRAYDDYICDPNAYYSYNAIFERICTQSKQGELTDDEIAASIEKLRNSYIAKEYHEIRDRE